MALLALIRCLDFDGDEERVGFFDHGGCRDV